MNKFFPTLHNRLFWLFAAFFTWCFPAFAGELTWEALPDRERLTITKSETEGIPGSVARISKQSVLIPFTEVPSGLIVTGPQEAALFNGTQQLGRALAIRMRTPEFGFVVTERTQEKMVLDIFRDPLGARWTATAPPPLTDVAPNYAFDVPGTTSANGTDAPQPTAPHVTWGEADNPTFVSGMPPVVQAPVVTASGNLVAASSAHGPIANGSMGGASRENGPTVEAIQVPPVQPQTAPPSSAAQTNATPAPVSGQPESGRPADVPTSPPSTPQPVGGVNVPEIDARNAPLPSLGPTGAQVQAPPASPAQPSQESGQSPLAAEAQAPTEKALPSVLPGVGIRVDQITYKGKINHGGASAIPPVSEAELARLFPLTAGDRQPAEQDAAQPAVEPSQAVVQNATAPEVIYMDEQGNVIPAPHDPVQRLAEIRNDVAQGLYRDALAKIDELIGQGNMTPDQLEEGFHIRAEMLFMVDRDNLEASFKDIADATRRAISYNPASPRNAEALLRLGYMNLRLGNLPEAEANFNQLRRQFPQNDNVPLTYYYWGDYFYNRAEYQRAALEFQKLMSQYPSSTYVKEAALGYARSNYRMGYYQQAFDSIKFIESKWQWFYIDYPPFLNMVGDVAYRLGDLDFALQRYWLYVNLVPDGDEADVILTRIGDIYALQHQAYAATAVYKDAAHRFPDKDGGLVAKMRLAEQRINDDPTISAMYDTFDDKDTFLPEEVYKSVIRDHPDSSLVPLAQLKLAMWHLWRHEYLRTLDTASEFMQKYADHELAPKMKETALKTFAVLSAESVADGTYGRMRSIWEQYPVLQSQEEILTPESRIALGVGYWKDGKPDDALIAVEPFFLGNKIPRYSEMALNLVLTIYLQYNEWDAIEEVGRRVQLWELEPAAQRQLDYTLALAYENTGQQAKAALLWDKLYKAAELPNDQMAYAAFYLARDAQENRRYDEAYLFGVDALKRLREEAERTPEQADTGKIMSQLGMLKALTENGGRLTEALNYADEYLAMLPENDQESRASTLYQIARIKREQGDEGAWRQGLEAIVQQYPTNIWGQKAATDLRLADLAREEKKFTLPGQ